MKSIFTTHRAVSIVAAALALAAVTTSTAAARPNDGPQSRFYVNPPGFATPMSIPQAQTSGNIPAGGPNPRQQAGQSSPPLPPILDAPNGSGLAAVRRSEMHDGRAFSYRLPGAASYSAAELAPYRATGRPHAARPPRIAPPIGSFDWGDAAIGAAAGVALSLFAVGLGMLVSRRRTRRVRGSAVVAR